MLSLENTFLPCRLHNLLPTRFIWTNVYIISLDSTIILPVLWSMADLLAWVYGIPLDRRTMTDFGRFHIHLPMYFWSASRSSALRRSTTSKRRCAACTTYKHPSESGGMDLRGTLTDKTSGIRKSNIMPQGFLLFSSAPSWIFEKIRELPKLSAPKRWNQSPTNKPLPSLRKLGLTNTLNALLWLKEISRASSTKLFGRKFLNRCFHFCAIGHWD